MSESLPALQFRVSLPRYWAWEGPGDREPGQERPCGARICAGEEPKEDGCAHAPSVPAMQAPLSSALRGLGWC